MHRGYLRAISPGEGLKFKLSSMRTTIVLAKNEGFAME